MIATNNIINSQHKNKDCWETPQHLFDLLNLEFKFTLDPCCLKETAKCSKFYTPSDNGLIKSWLGETVFVNPPYSRGNIDKWVHKCWMESTYGTTVVALLPVSTSSNWFHKYIYKQANIRFIKGRVKFNGANSTAPFSSMIVIWNEHENR
jgi:phage N-6-adenine-methyltransferase